MMSDIVRNIFNTWKRIVDERRYDYWCSIQEKTWACDHTYACDNSYEYDVELGNV